MCGNMMQWYDMVFVLPAPHVYFVVQYINQVSLITLPGCSTVRKTDVAVVRMPASNPRKLHVDHISWRQHIFMYSGISLLQVRDILTVFGEEMRFWYPG